MDPSQNKFVEAFGYLDGLDDLDDIDTANCVSIFMEKIGEICLQYGCYHAEKCMIHLSPKTLEFIKGYSEDLESFLLNIFEGYHEWEIVCTQRTNIEAFNTFFGDIYWLDMSGVDDLIEERGKYEGVRDEIIPKNIPDNHWWWTGERYGG